MSLLLMLKDHIADQGTVSLQDLANRFRTPPDALRGMLDHWVQKGLIRRHIETAACGTCPTSKCGSCIVPAQTEEFIWQGAGT